MATTNSTDALLWTLTIAYGFDISIMYVGPHFSVVARHTASKLNHAVGTGDTVQVAVQDCLNTVQLLETLRKRLGDGLCSTLRGGVFTCDNKIDHNNPSPNACSICLACQKSELKIESKNESAEAARIERDYK